MAKGQVTEEDLTRGLESMGSISSLGSGKPKRDNPFRDTREPAPIPRQQAPRRRTPKLKPEVPKDRDVQSTAAPVQIDDALGSLVATDTSSELIHDSLEERIDDNATKAEVFPERVTVPLSYEMKVQLDMEARDLQKIRPSKLERITANTLMRVAITVFLEKFQTTPVSSEEELLEVVRDQFNSR